jgi:hypothetical protein
MTALLLIESPRMVRILVTLFESISATEWRAGQSMAFIIRRSHRAFEH